MLASLIGQEKPSALLVHMLDHGGLPPTLILCGPDHIGKTTAAFEIAAALNCDSSQGPKPCGACASCRLIRERHHPDVRFASPVGPSRMLRTPQIWPRDGVKEFPPDAALLRDLHFGPAQGRVRVFIIEHAETMNEDTANSVLKVLEEPPTYAQFILTAPEPYALLPTIASRCHAVPFHLVPAIAIEQHLMAQYGIQDHMARFLATYVQGKIGLAIDLTKEEGLMDARKALLDLADRISAPNPPVYCLGLAEELRQLSSALLPSRKSEHGAETGQRSAIASGLDIVSTWYGDLLSLCVRPDKAEIVNTDRLKELRVRAGDYTANTLVQCIAIIQAIKVTCERNANAQIATEMLMAELVARNVKASAT